MHDEVDSIHILVQEVVDVPPGKFTTKKYNQGTERGLKIVYLREKMSNLRISTEKLICLLVINHNSSVVYHTCSSRHPSEGPSKVMYNRISGVSF
jgi:hypothetical protein